jgi:thiamine-phosphate pyrophosphorylase
MIEPPRLYLIVSAVEQPEAAAARLADMLDRADIACVELDLAEPEDAAWVRAIDALRPVAQDRDVAVLLRDRAELAVRTGCDGVRLTAFAGYRAARKTLGQAIVGVDAGLSRHEAMLAGEGEADFVALGPAEDGGPAPAFVEWWADLMVIPGVAFGARSASDAEALAAAGADFLALDPRIWPGMLDAKGMADLQTRLAAS